MSSQWRWSLQDNFPFLICNCVTNQMALSALLSIGKPPILINTWILDPTTHFHTKKCRSYAKGSGLILNARGGNYKFSNLMIHALGHWHNMKHQTGIGTIVAHKQHTTALLKLFTKEAQLFQKRSPTYLTMNSRVNTSVMDAADRKGCT